MDRTTDQFQFREGSTVYGADGDKVGKIIAVGPQYVVVEKGFFFPSDYYIPTNAIASVDGDDVYLNVTKDDALNSGWNQQPVDYGTTTAESAAWSGPGSLSGAASAAYDDTLVDAGTARSERPYTGDYTDRDLDDGGTIRLHEEELVAQKRQVDRGEVRLEKDVTAQEQVLEVPVTEEKIRVTRRTVNQDATGADADAFQEEVIEVPIRGEEVELGKRVRVTDEIDVEKVAEQRTQRVAGTVRREEVRVDDSTVPVDYDQDLDTAR